MENKAEQIIQKAIKLFMRYGIKSLTMDDVARELGMSKKTLYQFFDDKNDLVVKSLSADLMEDQCVMNTAMSTAKDAIEEVLLCGKCVAEDIKGMHPSILYDLQKYHPEAYLKFKEYKFNYVYQTVYKNILRGIKEGLYRENLNPEIVAKIYVARIDLILDPELFPIEQFTFVDVYKEMMRYHLYSLASLKGRKILDKIFEK